MNLIELSKINKSYGKGKNATKVLRGISLSVKRGEFVAIMGASGSGKTTLMNIIGLLDRQSSGRYRLNDLDINKLKDRELAKIRRKQIGFVFQSFNLLSRLSARRNIELPMIYNRISRKHRKVRSAKLLRLVGLTNRGRFKPNQLSGGQIQRVAIARSLANAPSLILADEPTGNLDSKTGDDVMKVFRRLNTQGKTIVVITHDTHVASYASRIIQIKDGRIQKGGRR